MMEGRRPDDCPSGYRRAEESECFEAVKSAGDVAGPGFKISKLKVIEDLYVPPGCSYSPFGGVAVFNRNPKVNFVKDWQEKYKLVCRRDERLEAAEANAEAEKLEAAGEAAEAKAVALFSDPSRTLPEEAEKCSVKEPKLLIVSAGGIGTTTTLSEFHKIPKLSTSTNCPGDNDGLKHLPFDRLVKEHADQLKSVKRILYLWGDPLHAVASLYRRGFHVMQATKTRSEPFADGTFSKKASATMTPKTIEEYAKSHSDVFQMMKHIQSYLAAGNGTFSPAIAFLQMERKTDHLDKLAHFLNVPRSQLKKHLTPWSTARRREFDEVQGMARATANGVEVASRHEIMLLAEHTDARNGSEVVLMADHADGNNKKKDVWKRYRRAHKRKARRQEKALRKKGRGHGVRGADVGAADEEQIDGAAMDDDGADPDELSIPEDANDSSRTSLKTQNFNGTQSTTGLSAEVEATINKKFGGLRQLTAMLPGDGFYVQAWIDPRRPGGVAKLVSAGFEFPF